MKLEQQLAEILALEAVGWIAGNDELLPVFLGATGASEEDLRSRTGDPDFLASVVDFLMMDDAWLTAFCDHTGRAYEEPAMARAQLPGGAMPNWT
ncbi:MAG: DUF3572 domain-containing protein [Pseudomonadota bacterium]